MEAQLKGIVHASSYEFGAQGKQFLGAAIECGDGRMWVIDYDEQSPFHAFAGRQVVVLGEPYEPEGQHLIGWREGKAVGHFRVSTMRLERLTPEAELEEVGEGRHLHGRFQRGMNETGDSTLSFVTEEGNAYLVANDPAGATLGHAVEVWAYPVQPSRSIPGSPERYLWIISPCSSHDLWEWRRRHA